MADLGERSFSSARHLVGRERELQGLTQQLDAAIGGHGHLVLINGEVGIGKTTLVEAISLDAEAGGMNVFWGRAYDLTVTPPYGPWLEIMRQCRSPR